VQLPDPIFISRQAALERLARQLASEPIIAVDTESNSLYAYQEQVCLVQFSTPSQDYLVDPLALVDLSALAPIFANPKIEKIFHAAEYDLICLKRDFGFEFKALFDTMLAARILGRTEIGLGSMLESDFEVTLDKRFQRANWGERPLPRELMAYARLDTHYLIALRNRLRDELFAKGLWALAVEDFTRICRVNGRTPDHRPGDCWRIRGAGELAPDQAGILMELCRYRDQAARAANRPLFKIISDLTLLNLAEACPRSLEQLREVRGMTQRMLERHGRGLLAAVERGLRAGPVYPPRAVRPDDRFLERLDQLRTWRKVTAQKMGVNSDVVLPRDLLYGLAEHNPAHAEQLADFLRETPWRLEHFGEQILKVLVKSG